MISIENLTLKMRSHKNLQNAYQMYVIFMSVILISATHDFGFQTLDWLSLKKSVKISGYQKNNYIDLPFFFLFVI